MCESSGKLLDLVALRKWDISTIMALYFLRPLRRVLKTEYIFFFKNENIHFLRFDVSNNREYVVCALFNSLSVIMYVRLRIDSSLEISEMSLL